MLAGIGTDIIEIDRIENALKANDRFLTRFFTEGEIAYFENRKYKTDTIAGRFAAKEAVAKALGTGFSGFEFKDIEVISNEVGKPHVVLHGKARLLAVKLADESFIINLSISHNNSNAIAFATLEKL